MYLYSMKFVNLLYELLVEEIKPHYVQRKGRLQDDVYLVLDLNLFAPSEENENRNFKKLLNAIKISTDDETVKKYVKFLNNYKSTELDSAYNVGIYSVSLEEINKITQRLERLEKKYTEFFQKIMDQESPTNRKIILLIHEYDNFGEEKILNVLNDENYFDSDIKMFTEKIIKFANNPKSESYFNNLRYKLSDTIKLYLKNEPLGYDDKGSIGESVIVVLEDRDGSIDMVTLMNERTSRIFGRHRQEGAIFKRWSDFENFESQKRAEEKSKLPPKPQTDEDKLNLFKKLKNKTGGIDAERMFKTAMDYYNLQKDFKIKNTDNERKETYNKLKETKKELWMYINNLSNKVDFNKDILPIRKILEKEISDFFDMIYQDN